jgi:protoporphyrinogen oxidase
MEVVRSMGITPVMIEASHSLGGWSRTVSYGGNRMNIGGHRTSQSRIE